MQIAIAENHVDIVQLLLVSGAFVALYMDNTYEIAIPDVRLEVFEVGLDRDDDIHSRTSLA